MLISKRYLKTLFWQRENNWLKNLNLNWLKNLNLSLKKKKKISGLRPM